VISLVDVWMVLLMVLLGMNWCMILCVMGMCLIRLCMWVFFDICSRVSCSTGMMLGYGSGVVFGLGSLVV